MLEKAVCGVPCLRLAEIETRAWRPERGGRGSRVDWVAAVATFRSGGHTQTARVATELRILGIFHVEFIRILFSTSSASITVHRRIGTVPVDGSPISADRPGARGRGPNLQYGFTLPCRL